MNPADDHARTPKPVIAASALRKLGEALSHIKDFDAFIALLEESVSNMLDVKQATISLTSGSASEIIERDGFLNSRFLIPLAVRNRLFGVLNVFGKRNEDAFGPADLQLMAGLSDFIAALVEHAGRYSEEVSLLSDRRLLLDSISCGVIAVSEKERIVSFNRAAGDILELKPPAMIGEGLDMLPAEVAEGLRRAIKDREVYKHAEFYLEKRDRFIGGSITPLIASDQEGGGASIIFTDLKDIEGSEVLRRCLDREIQRSRRYHRIMTLVILTAVTDFKELLAIIQQLRKLLRMSDICGRYDRNRLAIILPETDKQGATALLCRMRSALQGSKCRVGLATWPEDGATVEQLTKAAEENMLDLSVAARRTILAHDDSSVVNDMIELMLEDDYCVVKSTSVSRTLGYLEENRVDCFISEYDLHGEFDGPELVLKAKESNPMVKPFLTAFHMTPEKEEVATSSGVLALIKKPFDVSQFRSAIHKALD